MSDDPFWQEKSNEAPMSFDRTRWRHCLATLSQRCRYASASDQILILREAQMLLALAPPASRSDITHARDHTAPCAMELMLSAGAWESAALTLLPSSAAYMVSRADTEGTYLASILMPGSNHDVTSRGATTALALVGALVEALIDRPSGETDDAITTMLKPIFSQMLH